MMNVMGNKNLIILVGGAFILIIFSMYVMGVNNRAMLNQQSGQPYQNENQMMDQETEEMVVMLSAQGNSNESGVATLKETNGQTTVSISLTGNTENVAQPAHIHAGVCPGVGAVVYPLNSVVNGQSTTMLDVSIAQLMQQLPLAVNVHKSNEEISTYTSCGSL